jgi:hypothetical protein
MCFLLPHTKVLLTQSQALISLMQWLSSSS